MDAAHREGRAVWQLRLLDGFELRAPRRAVAAPRRVQRLTAFLALQGRRPRALVAGALWPDSTEAHALSSLRTTTVQARQLAPGLLEASRDPLSLSPEVLLDVDELRVAADEPGVGRAAHMLLTVGDLLPGWYEDWVLFERERLRQLRMRALDRLASHHLDAGNLPLALAAAQSSAGLEPLRETPHRLIVRIHLAAGDRVEALRVYQDFRRRSIEEFGLAPDRALEELVAPLLQERHDRAQRARERPTARPPRRR